MSARDSESNLPSTIAEHEAEHERAQCSRTPIPSDSRVRRAHFLGRDERKPGGKADDACKKENQSIAFGRLGNHRRALGRSLAAEGGGCSGGTVMPHAGLHWIVLRMFDGFNGEVNV